MAVYTKISDAEAAAFLSSYDLGTLKELAGIKQGVSESNYFLTTPKNRFVLTLYEQRTREEDLPFFLGLMEYLASRGVPCPVPMRDKTGAAFGRLAERPAAIISFLPGTPLARVTPDECAETGRAMARLHLAGQGFGLHRANALGLEGWEKLLAPCMARADEVRAGFREIIGEEIGHLRRNWPRDLPRGIIHADMFPNNVFFDGSKLCGVIDFYFACDDFFAYDLAIGLNAWCFEAGTSFNITKAQALVGGYNQVRPLSPQEAAALPLLARGAAMRFLSSRLYDWLHQMPGALVKPLDPLEYLTRLQFHQRAADCAAYGLAA